MTCTRWHTGTKTSTSRVGRGEAVCLVAQPTVPCGQSHAWARQIIDDRLIWFSHSSFNIVDFQRPDRVCSSFSPAFEFTGLIQISYIDEWEELFFFRAKRSGILFKFGGGSLFFDCDSWFFLIRLVSSPLRASTTSGSLLTQAVDRFSW